MREGVFFKKVVTCCLELLVHDLYFLNPFNKPAIVSSCFSLEKIGLMVLMERKQRWKQTTVWVGTVFSSRSNEPSLFLRLMPSKIRGELVPDSNHEKKYFPCLYRIDNNNFSNIRTSEHLQRSERKPQLPTTLIKISFQITTPTLIKTEAIGRVKKSRKTTLQSRGHNVEQDCGNTTQPKREDVEG